MSIGKIGMFTDVRWVGFHPLSCVGVEGGGATLTFLAKLKALFRDERVSLFCPEHQKKVFYHSDE